MDWVIDSENTKYHGLFVIRFQLKTAIMTREFIFK